MSADVEINKVGRALSPEQAAVELVSLARERGLDLTGPKGLLKLFTKNVLETALNEEMTEHLGHEKNRAEADRDSTNVRNGSRSKTVLSDQGNVIVCDLGVKSVRGGSDAGDRT